LGKEDTYKLTRNGTLRRYNKTGHNSSLSLGRLLMLKIGFNLPTPLASQGDKPIRAPSPSRIQGSHGYDLQERIGQLKPHLIGKKINPQFVEWIMGYPKDWTLLNETKL
jgi:hypothetical protein